MVMPPKPLSFQLHMQCVHATCCASISASISACRMHPYVALMLAPFCRAVTTVRAMLARLPSLTEADCLYCQPGRQSEPAGCRTCRVCGTVASWCHLPLDGHFGEHGTAAGGGFVPTVCRGLSAPAASSRTPDVGGHRGVLH